MKFEEFQHRAESLIVDTPALRERTKVYSLNTESLPEIVHHIDELRETYLTMFALFKNVDLSGEIHASDTMWRLVLAWSSIRAQLENLCKRFKIDTNIDDDHDEDDEESDDNDNDDDEPPFPFVPMPRPHRNHPLPKIPVI